jgi:lipoprotein NlpD
VEQSVAAVRGPNDPYRSSRAMRLVGLGLGLSLMAFFTLAGCSNQSRNTSGDSSNYAGRASAVHVVEPGETVYHIAQEYGVSVAGLMAANGIGDPRELRTGQRLTIPGHHGVPTGESGYPAGPALALGDPWNVAAADRQFAWPVAAGTVSSPFGMRHGAMHDGIDIAAPLGTPIMAADSGTVIFAGRLRGYGEVVIIQHSANYATVYGHNGKILTRAGASVTRGQEIAEMGMTGRATGPNLHFEVRYGNHPQNPLAYLPPPLPAGGISFARNGPG